MARVAASVPEKNARPADTVAPDGGVAEERRETGVRAASPSTVNASVGFRAGDARPTTAARAAGLGHRRDDLTGRAADGGVERGLQRGLERRAPVVRPVRPRDADTVSGALPFERVERERARAETGPVPGRSVPPIARVDCVDDVAQIRRDAVDTRQVAREDVVDDRELAAGGPAGDGGGVLSLLQRITAVGRDVSTVSALARHTGDQRTAGERHVDHVVRLVLGRIRREVGRAS